MTFKKIFKTIGWILFDFLAFIVLYLLSALVLSMMSVDKEPQATNDIAIYILTNGDHTDIVIPVKNKLKDWSNCIKFQNTISKDTTAQFLALGWGDKGFYLNTPTWSQLKFSVAFKAAFGLSSAAVHATFYKNLNESDDCKKIMISNDEYIRLVAYITGTFKKDINGNIINIKTNANYDNNDAFYEAKGRYNLFYTCNTWANNALKACGQKACVWTPFDKGIFYQYK